MTGYSKNQIISALLKFKEKSKANKKKVSAILIDSTDMSFKSVGWNQAPNGLPIEDEAGETIKEHVNHAEIVAMLRCPVRVAGLDMFVSYQPCHECAKHMASAGIHRVFYLEDNLKPTAYDLEKNLFNIYIEKLYID